MKILLKKIPFVFLLLFSLFTVESCQEQDKVNPEPVEQSDPTIQQRIISLGFDADEIKDMGLFYLVDGDVYFSKNETDEEKPESEPARIDDGKYPVFTVRMDNTVSANDNWKAAVDYAIAEWNADKNQHMHFALTTSADADITIRDANGEVGEEVALASEFAENGHIGSTIRVNLKYAESVTPEAANQKMFKALSRTTGYHKSKTSSSRKPSDDVVSAEGAKTQAVSSYVYIIWYDQLYRANKSNGSWSVLSEGWQGSTHMVLGDDERLYIIQLGTLYWADPTNGAWGIPYDGVYAEEWTGTQALVSVSGQDKLYANLYAIDQNKDLCEINSITGAKTRIADMGPRGTFHLTGNPNGLSITDSYQNALYYLPFKPNGGYGQLTTVANSRAGNWTDIQAMTSAKAYTWFVYGNTLARCAPELLPGETSSTKKITNSSGGRDWGGTVALVQGSVSFNNPSGVSIFFLRNGSLFLKSDRGVQQLGLSGDWAGAFLLACD